ncbi:hypothetical protein TNCV_3230071 [Trichonephila clavipes]|nr:hypothetical protein TNCV_3230071 [Trichonephila clavipes]
MGHSISKIIRQLGFSTVSRVYQEYTDDGQKANDWENCKGQLALTVRGERRLRLKWARHLIRLDHNRVAKKIFVARLYGTRKRGSLRLKWMDYLENIWKSFTSETGKVKPKTGQSEMEFLGRPRPTLGCRAIEKERNE